MFVAAVFSFQQTVIIRYQLGTGLNSVQTTVLCNPTLTLTLALTLTPTPTYVFGAERTSDPPRGAPLLMFLHKLPRPQLTAPPTGEWDEGTGPQVIPHNLHHDALQAVVALRRAVAARLVVR